MTSSGLDGRVVLVTGGSGAIGAAIARRFADLGAAVAVGWCRNVDPARATVEKIRTRGGRAVAVRMNFADPSSITDAAVDLEHRLGTVDVLVANAVAWPVGRAESWQAFADSMAVNVTRCLLQPGDPAIGQSLS